jgi:predicted MFS family arabinose efflux permease
MAIGQWTPMMTAILKGRTFAPEWMGGFGRFVEPVGILALFNALGRIFWGKISDLIDRPRAMMIVYLAQGMAFMILVSVNSHLAVFLASAWVGLNFGGNFALFPLPRQTTSAPSTSA